MELIASENSTLFTLSGADSIARTDSSDAPTTAVRPYPRLWHTKIAMNIEELLERDYYLAVRENLRWRKELSCVVFLPGLWEGGLKADVGTGDPCFVSVQCCS